MSTFDVRHSKGDLLVHLSDESFNPRLREILDELVPCLPHDEISQIRIDYLRQRSATHPKVHIASHQFGPICLELLQPSGQVSHATLRILLTLAGAIASQGR